MRKRTRERDETSLRTCVSLHSIFSSPQLINLSPLHHTWTRTRPFPTNERTNEQRFPFAIESMSLDERRCSPRKRRRADEVKEELAIQSMSTRSFSCAGLCTLICLNEIHSNHSSTRKRQSFHGLYFRRFSSHTNEPLRCVIERSEVKLD